MVTVVFSADFSVTWSFRNHSNLMIRCSRNISSQCWKQLFAYFLWKPWYIWIEISEEQHYIC